MIRIRAADNFTKKRMHGQEKLISYEHMKKGEYSLSVPLIFSDCIRNMFQIVLSLLNLSADCVQVLVGVRFLRQWPFIGRVRVCFVEPPYFQMTVKPLFGHGLDVTELPGISGWLVSLPVLVYFLYLLFYVSI